MIVGVSTEILVAAIVGVFAGMRSGVADEARSVVGETITVAAGFISGVEFGLGCDVAAVGCGRLSVADGSSEMTSSVEPGSPAHAIAKPRATNHDACLKCLAREGVTVSSPKNETDRTPS